MSLLIYVSFGMKSQPTEIRTALFRGFSDGNRLRIIEYLAKGQQRVADIVVATGLAQPNVSAHLACLWGCGLVMRERRGREVHYWLADGVDELLVAADAILAKTGSRVVACKNYGSADQEAAA